MHESLDTAVVDGSYLEGGGQILRYATSLGAILQKPVTVNNIRYGRNPPGLRPQHLLGVQLVANISRGQLTHCQVGSTEVTLRPGKLQGGQYEGDTKTAGSLCLLIQSILPPLLFTTSSSTVNLKGGTNVDFAPTVDYFLEVLPVYLDKFGVKYDLRLIRRGFYPAGGGQVELRVEPINVQLGSSTSGDASGPSLTPLRLTERGDIRTIRGVAHVIGGVSPKNAHIMLQTAEKLCKQHYPHAQVSTSLEKSEDNSKSKGLDLFLMAESSTGCRFAATRILQRNAEPNGMATEAFQELHRNLESGACCDEHMQDQVVIFMALARGESCVRVGTITEHTQTAVFVVQQLAGVKFIIEEASDVTGTHIMRCDGLAWNSAGCARSENA